MISDEDLLRLAAAPLDVFCAALLDEEPHTSAGELRDARAALREQANLEQETTTKAMFKRHRDAWDAARKGAGAKPPEDSDFDGRPPTVDQILLWLRTAAETGDADGALKWANTLAKVSGKLPTATKSPEDWTKLTEAEAACLCALSRKLNGAALVPDDLYFIELLGAVSAAPDGIHPAQIPLTVGPRPARLGKEVNK